MTVSDRRDDNDVLGMGERTAGAVCNNHAFDWYHALSCQQCSIRAGQQTAQKEKCQTTALLLGVETKKPTLVIGIIKVDGDQGLTINMAKFKISAFKKLSFIMIYILHMPKPKLI